MTDAFPMLEDLGENSSSLPFLATKLYIPRPRASLVLRSHLHVRLQAALEGPLTLVAAPAGFGKTTLLAGWIQHLADPTEQHIAWISLDDGDNDPVHFWSYVLLALDHVCHGIATGSLPLLQSPQPLPTETMLTVVLNQLAALPSDIVLVLDDYHTITASAIHEALTFLIDHAPPNLHVLLASRSDPPLPLARWRARGHLAEVRAADLRFTFDEAAMFLTEVMGLSLSADQVNALETRTEGWIAGLHLAALSLRGRADVHGFITAFTGSHRHVVDYLMAEVLERQPAAVQAFLLHTAILERLCAPLCEAVTGQRDSQTLLEGLEQANLFLIPLDEERRWYRYHHLFADVLRARLLQAYPDVVPSLHQEAAAWYGDHGFVEEAIEHALAACDWPHAIRMLEQVAYALLRRGEAGRLRTWSEAMPDDLLRTHPDLCVAHAWALVITGALDAAEPRLQIVEQSLAGERPNDDAPLLQTSVKRQELLGDIAAIRAAIALQQGNAERAITCCHAARTQLPATMLGSLSVVALYLGDAYVLLENFLAARQAYAEFMTLSRQTDSRYFARLAANRQALVEMRLGYLPTAAHLYQQYLLEISEPAWDTDGVLAEAHISLGCVLYERNDLHRAADHFEQGIVLAQRAGSSVELAWGYASLARVQHARGEHQQADELLARAEQLAAAQAIPRLATHIAAYRVRWWLTQHTIADVVQWAHAYRAGTDNERMQLASAYMRDVALLTLPRVELAQGRRDDALHLLEHLHTTAGATGRIGMVIEVLAMRALAFQAQGDLLAAVNALEQALTLAEPQGYIRTFLDEGRPMVALLQHAAAQGIAPNYIRTLLAAVPRTEEYVITTVGASLRKDTHFSALAEPLTAREVEVLRLLAAGMSNPEIAQRCVVSINTVKTQLQSIYGKLGVHRRADAVAKARALHLLP